MGTHPVGQPDVSFWAPAGGWVQKKGPHVGHRLHLCDMVDRGDVSLEQYKELVKSPKFICKDCGRVAAREENLCEPLPL